MMGTASPLLAQARYRAEQFGCAHYKENVIATINTQIGSEHRREDIGQSGTIRVVAQDTTDGVSIEAWYDSLTVFRDAAEGRLAPETDGVIGGRYRGFLSGEGRYTRSRVPFVPEDVGEVVNLATALDDFFPRLPPTHLKAGDTWSDSMGTTIARLDDSLAAGRSLERYDIHVAIPERPVPAADSTSVDVIQGEEHHGRYVWRSDQGVLRWDREITVRTTVPPGGEIRQSIKARVVQHIVVERLPDCTMSAP
jgi:hypothetical protein